MHSCELNHKIPSFLKKLSTNVLNIKVSIKMYYTKYLILDWEVYGYNIWLVKIFFLNFFLNLFYLEKNLKLFAIKKEFK